MAININNLNTPAQVKQKVDQQVQIKQQASQAAVKSEQVKHSGQDSVSLTPQAKQLQEANSGGIFLVECPETIAQDISSTEIRAYLQQGINSEQLMPELMPKCVLQYINSKQLYR